MKITKVSYRKLVSDGNFNNESFGAEALVEDDENSQDALEALKVWVGRNIEECTNTTNEINSLHTEIYNLRYTKNQFSREVEELKAKVERMIEFLGKHGVEVSTDDLPF